MHCSQFRRTASVQYPPISPIAKETTRPLWSVMIPTYNGAKYLEQTLHSVLEQDPGSEKMQIEVVDDCSTQDDLETLVKEVGKGRINFFRNSKNLGLINNWNSCIQRSRGHWIHILHQDDIVLSGFYERLKIAFETESSIGAVFCRHAFMDEEGHWLFLSPIEQRASGILESWIERLAVAQKIQFPSIVVKREVYETLNGFLPEIHYASDWEMWNRISVKYPVWYEPKILACYRQHSISETSRCVQTGADIADTRKAINLVSTYLPLESAHKLSCQAKEHYALYALNTARQMLSKNHTNIASVQVREALRCSCSLKVIRSVLPLIGAITQKWLKV